MAFETQNYGTVEATLVASYGVPAKARGAFRSRLGALQKGGLFGAKNMPGKGRALAYGPDQFHRAVFACELLECGVAPSVVLSIVKALWQSRLRKIFQEAEDAVAPDCDAPGPDDVILTIEASLMTSEWRNALPAVKHFTLREFPDEVARVMVSDGPRVLVTNLSQALRRFHSALADSYTDELRGEARSTRHKPTKAKR